MISSRAVIVKSFLETVRIAKAHLEEQGRVSLRALRLEFGLNEEELEGLAAELVEVQQVAAREGATLVWCSPGRGARHAPASDTAAPPEPAPEGERRQLTLLFCDIVGSTRIAAELDAEDWHALVIRYQERCAEAIERFGGHVAQYLGDGILAYFGWPRAREDAAERAVRAGLAIVEAEREVGEGAGRATSLALEVRVGIHTGPVVVGEVGAGEHRERLAVGDAPNVAARLQAEAEPGSVLLSGATLRLVPGIFVTRDLGLRELKGVGTIPVHAAIRPSGMRSRLDAAAARGLTPLVGRDRELELLEDGFALACKGQGRAVFVAGEAGIGKSRLVAGFRERLALRAHSWLEARCTPYTLSTPFHPVLELQRHGFGFRPDDPAQSRLERLEAGLAAVGFDPAETLPYLASLHSLPVPEGHEAPIASAEGRRKKTLELLAEWLLRLGHEQPVVLLVEDVHWLDPSTRELLGRILDRLAAARLLLLLTHRPELEVPFAPHPAATSLALERLAPPEMASLVRGAARERTLPSSWVDEIAQRSDGVPLFAEELVRTALEAHPDLAADSAPHELHVPETLQDTLMARLDALDAVKELVQLAAVLGREFEYEMLRGVSPWPEERLRAALAHGLQSGLFLAQPGAPAESYAFAHALMRDAAYESLLRTTRRRHHLLAAEALIERMPAIAEAQPELVAHHLSEARVPERALTYWKRAGERAIARAAYEEATRHLRRGLALVEELPGAARGERELELLLALGVALFAGRGYGHPETLAAWERARTLCDPALDPQRSGRIHYYIGFGEWNRARMEPALESASRALEIGEGVGDELLIIAGCAGRALPLLYQGRLKESLAALEWAIALYDPARHRFREAGFLADCGIIALAFVAFSLWHVGYPDRAAAACERMIELARSAAQPYELAYALALAAVTDGYRRDWERTAQRGSEAAEIASEHGFRLLEGTGRLACAASDALGARDPGGLDRFVAAMAMSANAFDQAGAPAALSYLARIQLEAGRLAEALATARGGLAIAERTGQHYRDADLLRLEGEVLRRAPGHAAEEAEARFRRAIETAQRQGARSLELISATSFARLLEECGRRGEGRAVLAPVYGGFTEGFDTPDLIEAKELLDRL